MTPYEDYTRGRGIEDRVTADNPRPPDEPIRSYAEYRARYFPEQVERERLAALTPEELGREWAERALDKFHGR